MSKIEIDIKKLFDAGVHFGHFKRRWHPNMANYIHSIQKNRCLIDLVKTKQSLERALPVITEVASKGQRILFVGTKKQAQAITQTAAESVQMPYVVNRWVGGMLTNHVTISKQVKKLKDLENKLHSGELANRYNKLEVQNFKKQIDSLNFLYGGCKEMSSLPNLVFVNDMLINSIAVTEANKLNIPVVALADTNVDPNLATYPIYANDDAITSVQILIDLIITAIKHGQNQIKTPVTAEKTVVKPA